jgi:hypothetical protein
MSYRRRFRQPKSLSKIGVSQLTNVGRNDHRASRPREVGKLKSDYLRALLGSYCAKVLGRVGS